MAALFPALSSRKDPSQLLPHLEQPYTRDRLEAGAGVPRFQCDSLHLIGPGLEDLPARGRGAGERDLLDARVSHQQRAKVVISTQHLENRRRKDLLC